MRFHVLTLFPQMIEQGLSESITGRALKQNIISLNTVNIRDFAHNKHNKVDDYIPTLDSNYHTDFDGLLIAEYARRKKL